MSTISVDCIRSNSVVQWRIQDFTEGAPTREGALTYYLVYLLPKMHENENKFRPQDLSLYHFYSTKSNYIFEKIHKRQRGKIGLQISDSGKTHCNSKIALNSAENVSDLIR